jgi:uncharacterized membrane protein (UPF0127 family)
MMQIVLQERTGSPAGWQLVRKSALVLASLALSATSAMAQLPSGPQHLPVVKLTAGMHVIKAEVAQTPREHEIGLMWRTSMGSNEGMIFIFPQDARQCFWMKNTLIPLSVAFVTADGRIANLDEMQAQTENSHCSTEPIRYVLEMNKGWFTKKGIKAGDKLAGPVFPQH